MRKITLVMLILAFLVPISVVAQVRVQRTFEKGWKFTREDQSNFSSVDYDDAAWFMRLSKNIFC